MGALLSLPLLALPSMGTLVTAVASCCGAATCSALCNACGRFGFNNSIATRIAYAVILLLNSILSWVLLTDWAVRKLEGALLNYTTISCNGKACTGFVAVHRVNFALGFFHVLLALILLGVKSTRDTRSQIQNGFWGIKIIMWIGFLVLTFLIPDAFFVVWGKYVAIIGAVLFLLLGLILLVDLSHTWAETCVDKIEQNDSTVWKVLLIGSTVLMYLLSTTAIIVMYIFFAGSGCAMNQAAITVNLLLALIISVMSVHPSVQEYNPRAGLAQAAMVCIYCTYLTFSAVAMEPDDKSCNPLVRASPARKTTVIVGALITFITCAYTTTRAATYGLAMGTGRPAGYLTVGDEEVHEHGLIDRQPDSRKAMRQEALRQAVASGSLPASALDESDDEDDDDDGKNPRDDERDGTQYNYSLFHIIFLLSTMWIAILLTQGLQSEPGESFHAVGRTYFNSWVKIASSWVCYLIFLWSLVAPIVLQERFDY